MPFGPYKKLDRIDAGCLRALSTHRGRSIEWHDQAFAILSTRGVSQDANDLRSAAVWTRIRSICGARGSQPDDGEERLESSPAQNTHNARIMMPNHRLDQQRDARNALCEPA